MARTPVDGGAAFARSAADGESTTGGGTATGATTGAATTVATATGAGDSWDDESIPFRTSAIIQTTTQADTTPFTYLAR